MRGRADVIDVGQTPNVYRNAFFLTTYVFWIAKFRETLSEKARKRPRFAQLAAFGVASYGLGVGRLPPLGYRHGVSGVPAGSSTSG